MVPNLDEWQQVENMHAFENYMREVTPFLKSAHILLMYNYFTGCTYFIYFVNLLIDTHLVSMMLRITAMLFLLVQCTTVYYVASYTQYANYRRCYLKHLLKYKNVTDLQ